MRFFSIPEFVPVYVLLVLNVWKNLLPKQMFFLCIYKIMLCVYLGMFEYIHIHARTFIYIYIYIYISVMRYIRNFVVKV